VEADLHHWYAEPLNEAEAEALLAEAGAALHAGRHRGDDAFPWRLRELVARWWLQRPVASYFQTLRADAGDDRQRALVELVYGQLLMSRRLRGALEHLQAGFVVAAHLLAPGDYFRLLKRHQRLARLPLGERPAPPRGLQDLLREADVIARLEGPQSLRPSGDQGDTLG